MSATEVVKQDNKKLTDDPTVREVMEIVRGNPDGMADLEVVLMELVLFDLHRKRPQIEAAGRKARGSEKDIEKFYRALTKSAVETGNLDLAAQVAKARRTISKAAGKEIWIETYDRGGQVVASHWRPLPSGYQPRRGDVVREIPEGESRAERRQARRETLRDHNLLEDQRGRESTTTPPGSIEGQMAAGDRVTPKTSEIAQAGLEGIFSTVDNPRVQGAMASFLRESSIAQGIVSVAQFFSRTQGKFQFAARAIAEFGPIAGVRLAHTYFRYGGYDVPLKERGGRVKTEMGDTLPDAKDAKTTRQWAIDTLKKRLPGQSAEDSDAEPPSEGFIIDKNGNILAHGVGRGNDHFLPFNTRHLRQMRQEEGVEYVRRRMFGGPTVEDLHAAMMMGAERLTIISNGGQFTVELTKRSHGIKMEHVQIISRFQDILDDKGDRLNFNAYNSALKTLEAEFPLHFKKSFTERGGWADRDDRIRPKESFRDQLRNLFDVMGGGDGQSATEQVRDKSGRITRISGQRLGQESVSEAFRRQIRQNPEKRSQLLGELKRFYRDQGTDPSSVSLVRDQEAILNRERQRGGREVRTPSTAGERWRDVEVRQSEDPTMQRARSIQPTGDVPRLNPKARRRMVDELGLDPQGVDPGNTRKAAELARTLNTMQDRTWDETRGGEDFLDAMRRTFRTITD